jgi:hypothetical protein
MTLLCHVLTDDAVLLSADNAANQFETDPLFVQPFPAVVPREKILPTGMPTVMWGYAGFQLIVEPVVDWASSATFQSWDQLAEEVRQRCNAAVLRARATVRGRGLPEDDPRLLFSVMFAGYIGDEPGSVIVDHLGFTWTHPGEKYEPASFGGGQTLGTVAWTVLKKFLPDMEIRTADELGRFMDAVCESADPLGAPADVWRITTSGWEKVDRGAESGSSGE